jgi:hypothetical protein
MSGKKTVKLEHPINVYAKDISEVELKEPKGKQISKIGLPFSLGVDGSTEINTGKVGKYFDALAGFPAGTHEQLTAPDFVSVSGQILTFFGESDQMKT